MCIFDLDLKNRIYIGELHYRRANIVNNLQALFQESRPIV